MTRLTRNYELEQISKVKFKNLTLPWLSQVFEQDTGIDLIVQPYDELKRNEDKSIPPFEKRFLVQLKSTESEVVDEVNNLGKLQIDIEHLKSWKIQHDPVMIARYYMDSDCFYYQWIDDIQIKEDQKSQTIILANRLDENLKNIVKENILDFLIPPDVSNLIYEPKDEKSVKSFVQIKNIRRSEQLKNILIEILPSLRKEALIRQKIHSLKFELDKNNNFKLRIKLAFLYIRIEKWNEVLSELNILSNTYKVIEATILTNVIKRSRFDILKNLNTVDFAYLLVFEDGIERNTGMVISLDGKEYRYYSYEECGVRLPNQKFSKIDYINFNVKANSVTSLGSGTVSTFPIRMEYSFKILKVLIKENKVLTEFSEVIVQDKFKTNFQSMKIK